MQCPVCGERMKEIDRVGISIDMCPGCKGVWLDRGELDKLIAVGRQNDAGGGPALETARHGETGFGIFDRDGQRFGQARNDHDHDRQRGHDHDRERGRYSEHGREHGDDRSGRRGSWLENIFGGDD